MAKKSPSKKTGAKKKSAAKKTKARAAGARRRPQPNKLLDLNPDQVPLTERRAAYLAERAGVAVEEIAGRRIAEVHEKLRWKLDPSLFFFRRVCGRVVKKDPITGELLPVPNATVYVEDTDCGFLGYFPKPTPWAWLYPLFCRREVIDSVRTDHCGRFCVDLPLWDIDRILRWRKAKICYWQYFRPQIRDLLELEYEQPPIRRPRPLPDPPPVTPFLPERIERIRDLAGDGVVERLQAAQELSQQGESLEKVDAILDQPLFDGPTPPPLPAALTERKLDTTELASVVGELDIQKIDPRRFIGPFLRCRDIYIGTWQTVLDVPDITFRVTQDYDGDGVEEEIYSEGFFDVRWDSGPIPDVTLEASGNALSSPLCGPPRVIPCGNTPSIESAGYLDLEPAYHDDTDGFGLRVNRPTATGDYPPPPVDGAASPTPANAPYALNLNLHGCVRLRQATHYKVRYQYRANPSDPWGAEMTFQNISWVAPRQGPGAPIPFVPDGDGWYQIQPAGILVHPNWLLPWNTSAWPDGTYRLRLVLGRLTGGTINQAGAPSNWRVFEVDNSKPVTSFTEVRWRLASDTGSWNSAQVVLPAPPGTCPVIERPVGQDIHIRVVWSASAKHLRNAGLVQSGCGGGGLDILDPAGSPDPEAYRHWHRNPLDNNVSQTNLFLLRASRPPGCYTLGIRAWSRAFNPQDYNAASTKDWWVNDGVHRSWPSRAISVVDVTP